MARAIRGVLVVFTCAAIAPVLFEMARARAVQSVDAPATWARGIEGQRKADLGNGLFLNPIMAGDHPDPTVLKDGGDY